MSTRSLQHQAEKLFGELLPRQICALDPARLFFDQSRRARRMKAPARPDRRGLPPAHRHSTFELCFALGGGCPFLLGEDRIAVHAGDVVVLAPEVFHSEMAEDECGPYELLWMAFMRKAGSAHIQKHTGKGRFDRNVVNVWLDDLIEPLRLAEAIDMELYAGRPGHFTRVKGMLLEIVGHYERAFHENSGRSEKGNGPGPSADSENRQRWRVQRAVEYVRDHYSQSIDLPEVAQHVGVSPGHMSALFTRALGRSFTHFLAACRLEEAQRLLADPSLSIKEIAHRVGLENPFYFSRLFRKHTGHSPQQYRQRLTRQ